MPPLPVLLESLTGSQLEFRRSWRGSHVLHPVASLSRLSPSVLVPGELSWSCVSPCTLITRRVVDSASDVCGINSTRLWHLLLNIWNT
jgi:hypothetical protein